MNKIYMIPAISLPPHSQYGTMGKPPNSSEPQLFHLQDGTDTHHTGLLWDLNELGFIEHPRPHLASASRVVNSGFYSVEEQVLDYLWALGTWVEDSSLLTGASAQELRRSTFVRCYVKSSLSLREEGGSTCDCCGRKAWGLWRGRCSSQN